MGQTLIQDFGVPSDEISKALKFRREYGGRLGEILVNSGVISEEQISLALAHQSGLLSAHEELKKTGNPAFEPLGDIDPAWYIANEAIPLFERENVMYFALRDPLNLFAQETLRGVFSGKTCGFLLADERKYRELSGLFSDLYLKRDGGGFNRGELEKLRDLAGEAPIIKFVNAMIARAAEYHSSDIHLESQGHFLKIRYRIDGVLKDVDRVVSDTASAIISRIKIMAEMDIGEKRLPQDGRIQLKVSGRLFDIRVSTLPTIHGENIVMRLLEKEAVEYDIRSLGLIAADSLAIGKLIAHNYGLILVTGPTGSGKSTTLYSILSGLNNEERKIITVEDPVEYQISGISQIQVQEQIGLSFVSILRNILRQDPDIIMIGEIRDLETAEIAVRASLTGHLVLATLHTNDALSAITRLVDMGIQDYLVNSSLLGVVAQRLVRRICPHCSAPVSPSPEILEQLNWRALNHHYQLGSGNFRKGRGCDLCAGTGYKGRVGVFEILGFNDRLKSALSTHKDYESLKHLVLNQGFKTLRDDAVIKWAAGETTAEEIFRVT